MIIERSETLHHEHQPWPGNLNGLDHPTTGPDGPPCHHLKLPSNETSQFTGWVDKVSFLNNSILTKILGTIIASHQVEILLGNIKQSQQTGIIIITLPINHHKRPVPIGSVCSLTGPEIYGLTHLS